MPGSDTEVLRTIVHMNLDLSNRVQYQQMQIDQLGTQLLTMASILERHGIAAPLQPMMVSPPPITLDVPDLDSEPGPEPVEPSGPPATAWEHLDET